MKKIFLKNKSENTIVRVSMYADSSKKGKVYECTGVLMREEKDMIRVAFSAMDEKVIDYVDIDKSNILSVETVKQSDIKVLS